jgi:6,7-dimethyl-8-ribityllumazine synthase
MTHILIVSANFYPELSAELIKGAVACLEKAGVSYERIEVPGAFEIPAAIGFALAAKKYHGYLALGCVIRGETSHYDYVCNESARGLMELALHHHAAIGYGILTVENEAQAWARAKTGEGNKGRDAAEACLRMITLKQQFKAGA